MQSENDGVTLKVLADGNGLLQLQLDEESLRPDIAVGHDPMAVLLGERGYGQPALLSLAETRFISSSGLGLLLIWHKRFRQAGGKLVLHSITTPVMETLRILRLEMVLNVAADTAAATEAARGDAT